MGMYTPESAGGLGMGRLDASLIVEELAKGCTTTAAFLTIHNMATAMIGKYCQQTVVDEWCPDLSHGRKLASYCLTEPGAAPTPVACAPAQPSTAMPTWSMAVRCLSPVRGDRRAGGDDAYR
ncbi:MAG: hypothetical protein CM15mP103_12570 [Gammaproteobacteria bacterium]|nr:MAG: hypothetical protein CM15mP103_12570 [Gammaproteobacteria bacterium]